MDSRTTLITRDIALSIAHELRTGHNLSYSILAGDFGKIIYLYYAEKAGVADSGTADAMLMKMLNSQSHGMPMLTYCNGIAGMSIGMELLQAAGFIEGAEEATEVNMPLLSKGLQQYLSVAEIDFLHGALGIAFYFLRHAKRSEEALKQVKSMVDWLWQHAIWQKDEIHWTYRNLQGAYVPNISISHGESSTAVFLARAHGVLSGGYRRKASDMLVGIGKYLMSQIYSPELLGSFTPVMPVTGKAMPYRSRLGWCYGDIGVSVALREIGITIGEPSYCKISELMSAYAATRRRDLNAASIWDAGLCHGASGVAQYFRHCYAIYGQPIYLDAYNYWREQVLTMAQITKGYRSFGKYSLEEKWLLPCHSLLEGDAGVGLMLLGADRILNNLMLYEK